MSASQNTYTLVLLGRFPGKDKPVAQALGRAFGRDESWGLPIVGATPINLIVGLASAQAQAIKVALAEVEQAGSRIQIQPSADESCPTVSWPGEPKVYGRPASAFTGGTMVAAAAGASTPCPHCGKPVLVRLLAAASQPAGQPSLVQIPVPPVQAKEPPTPHRASPPVPIPVPVPVPQAPRPLPMPQPLPQPLPSAAPDGLEELVPIQDFAPGNVAAPPMRMPQAPGKMLPEVPVVDGEPALPPVPAPAVLSNPGDTRMVPVDLEAFEAGLQMGPAPEAPEDEGPPPEHVMPPVKPGIRRRGVQPPPPANPDALCSVFIGKSRDARVHELVAEIQGTSVEEAEDLCQKAVVPVVKDIPVSEAEGIKQRFQELKVNPRIAVKR